MDHNPPPIYGRAIKVVDGRPVFIPAGQSQARFLESPAPSIVFNSDVGGGKSLVGSAAIHGEALAYPGSDHLVMRATATACIATTLEVYRQELLGVETFDQRIGGNQYRRILRYPNGSTVIFSGLDDPTVLQSGFYGSAFLDELVPNLAGGRGVTLSQWNAVGLRLRHPAAKIHRLLGACNAGPPKHWVLEEAKGGRLELIRGLPGENDKNLPRDYLKRKKSYAGIWFRRYVLNQWCAQEGVVFEEWDSLVHDRAGIAPPKGHPIRLGVDFGFNHPFSAVAFYHTNIGAERQYRIFGQVHGGREQERSQTTEDWAKQINGLWLPSPIVRAYCDHSPGDQATLKRHCPRIRETVNAEKRDERWALDVLKAMFRRRLANGEPAILIDGVECAPLIDEIETLAWKVTREGEVLDKPVDVRNDSVDSLKYGVVTDLHGGPDDGDDDKPVSSPRAVTVGRTSPSFTHFNAPHRTNRGNTLRDHREPPRRTS